MSVQFLEYPLQDGFVNNWLVAGPLLRPVSLDAAPAERKAQIFQEMPSQGPGDAGQPAARKTFPVDDETLAWRYFRCAQDHFVDVSAIYPRWQHARSWAFASLVLPQPGAVTFSLALRGPATLWINGQQVFQSADFPEALARFSFITELQAENDLRVCFDQVCAGACTNQMALRLVDLPAGVGPESILVRLPTEAKYPRRQRMYEELFEKAYLETISSYRGTTVNLHWAEDTSEDTSYTYQLQDDQERIYVEGTWGANTQEALDIGHPQRIFERPMWVVLRAPGREYYEQDLRYERRMPFYVLDNAYSHQPYGDITSRRLEALQDAAHREGHLFAEIAKMALGQWEKLDASVIQASIARSGQPETGTPAEVAGMLCILYRFAGQPDFPQALKSALEACVTGYGYTAPAEDPAEGARNLAILHHTLEILAGQRYPQHFFTPAGLDGSRLREHGEQQALDWLVKRGRGGYIPWDANSTLEQVIMALSLLTSLAEHEEVRELSAVLLDKILFLMATNTFQGAYGSTHGASGAAMIKSAQLEATSGITRLLWGMGVFNRYLQGTVALACSDYEYPSFFADIAAGLPPTGKPEPLWSKEQHVSDPDDPQADRVNKVNYRSADYMLSSAQDYHPGQPGRQEHIWQATLGADAVVFANHPASMGDDDAQRPGFWLGNAVLPRVAQWKDALIAVHRLPEDDWMGFTHAYFPTFAFDEYALEGGWAFARKGKGYLAITAMQGIELIKHGPDGYRELRSPGRENIWVCLMGRDAQDVSYSAFKVKVLRIKPDWQPGAVRFTTPRGEELAFGWEGPLRVAGQEQPLSGFKHIENPYCSADLPADHLDIAYGDYLLRLNYR